MKRTLDTAKLALCIIVVQTSIAHLAAQSFKAVTTVVAIEIPVQVVRDGKPVRGLTAEDFEIFEGRKQHEIVAFEEIDLGSTTTAPHGGRVEKPLPITARRHFLLLFDLSFSDPKSITVARSAARDLIQNQAHPQDLIAVGTYSDAQGFKLILGFSSDRGQVDFALENLGLAQPLHGVEDPLGLLIADLSAPSGAGGGGGAGNRAGDVVNEFRDMQIQTRRNTRDQKENQAIALMSSLESVGTLLRSVQGRVQVVLLSEGFETSVILGAEGTTQEEQARLSEMALNVAFGESFRVNQDERYGSTRALSAMERMLEEFRRADAAIHTVDIGGLQAGADVQANTSSARSDRANGLFIMANETGGEFYRNTNDLGVAMTEVFERTSVTYVLVFQPSDIALDGSYHKLKVRLKDAPRGTRLIHREGYYAPLPYNQQSPESRRLATAGLLMGGNDGGSIDSSVIAVPVRDEDGGSYVAVLIEIDGEALLSSPSSEFSQAEIYAYALDEAGSIKDFFTERVGLALEQAGEKLRESGLKYWGELDLAPGEYLLRVLTRNGMTGESAIRTLDLTVPDLEDGKVHFLPPLFPEPMNKWLLAREEVQVRRSGEFPFVLQGQPFFPSALPSIADNSIATVCVMNYGLSGHSIELAGRFLDGDGMPVEGPQIWVNWLPNPDPDSSGCLPTTIQAIGIESGSYTLEITGSEAATGSRWSSSIPVSVSG